MKKMVILGPQGSGKGTQAQILADKLGVPALSMGQLLRDEIAAGSELGQTIHQIINVNGDLVPDEITTQVLQKRLAQSDVAGGYVLDGYPRFMEQYENSKSFLNPSIVLVFHVPQEVSVERLLKRGEIEGREDDTREKIEHRLKWTHKETEPVIEEYRILGRVRDVDGVGSVPEVAARVEEALGEQYGFTKNG